MENNNLLEVTDLMMRFGGLLAVDHVQLQIKKQQVASIIGPNGAGKTTVFNCITGFYKPTGGTIIFDGEPVHGLAGYKIARKGMVRTFQHVRLFKEMTVVENLLIAQHHYLNTNIISGLFKTTHFRHSEAQALEQAKYWLKKVDLLEHANRLAGNLAYGQQRRLEIARCMVSHPRLLMLDEPAAGLNPRETADLNDLIVSLRDNEGISIVLIEHDMKLVMDISDYIYVVNQGRPLAHGIPAKIQSNPDVIKAYLGES